MQVYNMDPKMLCSCKAVVHAANWVYNYTTGCIRMHHSQLWSILLLMCVLWLSVALPLRHSLATAQPVCIIHKQVNREIVLL